jgi:2-(1,2-epoxy-1,2-dihydrophenyl)acetyl-CoA isomerase
MADDEVRLDIADGVAEIVLDRPRKGNSLDLRHVALLRRRIDAAVAARVGCILFRGEGEAFCAGRDLAGFDFEAEDSYEVLADHVNPLCACIRELRVPTLAVVQGACLGLGFGIAMAMDIIYAADDARLGSPFRTIGCALDSGGHHALMERVGRHRAAELIFTGRLIDGREAERIGLVNGAMGKARLLAFGRATARRIASGPRLAFAESKVILAAGGSFDAMAEMEALAQGRLSKTRDMREGITAFIEKRTPNFIGA